MTPHILKIIEGPEKGRSFQLDEGQTIVVGRGSASDTKINDPRVSRVHCRIELEGGKATLRAAESAGTTTIQGETIEKRQLTPGEVFRIGDTYIRLDGGHNPLEQSTMQGGGNLLDDLIGASFAHYQIKELVSRGASGVVYQALDTENNRKTAVKVLLPSVSSSEVQRERFVRAMKTMLPIRHPNIVRLFNAGKKAQFCWIAMEWIDGEGMDQVIRRLGVRNMLDWQKVWEVAVDIGRALEHAEKHKIVHRNLAPANIICRSSDKVNLLGDLMFAKASEGTQSFDVTAPGQLLGNLAYTSPERTLSNQDIDVRSDIYELGATLYALLTGRPPLEAHSQIEQIKKIRDEDPVPPKEYQIGINDMFQKVVMTMLAKRPADRYKSASDLLTDLKRVGTFSGLTRD